MKTNFMFAGVGGQGILVAAELVALVGLALGLDVKESEIHGVAQRGGSVNSEVRWGAPVYSPLILPGEVDFLLAFERLEALRYLHLLRPKGVVLCNDYIIPPITAAVGTDRHPLPTRAEEAAAYVGIGHYVVPAMRLAQELGNPRVSNVVLLGALSALMDVPEQVWQHAIALRVPESLAPLNQKALAAGRAYLLAEQGRA